MGRLTQLGFIILFAVDAHAQALTVNQFLKSSLDDPLYKSFDLQSAYLQREGNYNLPWLDEFQVRYQDNELQNIEQRYALRLEPGNPWRIGNNRKYFKGVQTLKLLEQKLALKEILLKRYELLTGYWVAAEHAALIQKQKEKREQIGSALAQKAGSSSFDADQYLDSQIDIISKEADWQEAVLDRDVALSKILSTSGQSSFEFNADDFISVDRINQLIQSGNVNSKTELEFFRQQLAVSDQKVKLEKSNVDIGYLQAMYTDRENKIRNPLGIAFGITIPLFNPNKDDIAREKINQMETQGSMEEFLTDEKRKMVVTLTTLQLHFNHYQKLDSLINQFQQRGMNFFSGAAKNYDPVVELKYQERLLQFDILKSRIKKQILFSYIGWLHGANKLHERPLINYLSKDLLRLED